MVTIKVYKNEAEPKRIDKTNYIYSFGEITGTFRDNVSITHPSILIEIPENTYSTIWFNYIYIPEFSRYYFVDEIICVRNRLWLINCRVDVLMSFKDGISDLYAYVARSESDYNDYLIDNERLVENKPNIDVVEATTIFTTTNVTSVLLNYYK